MIKFRSVDFGRTVSLALIAPDVTLVVPREVTPPVTVWLMPAELSADVTAAGFTVCVWSPLGTDIKVCVPKFRFVEALGPDDVVVATLTE